jgi:hypothetical protein
LAEKKVLVSSNVCVPFFKALPFDSINYLSIALVAPLLDELMTNKMLTMMIHYYYEDILHGDERRIVVCTFIFCSREKTFRRLVR